MRHMVGGEVNELACKAASAWQHSLTHPRPWRCRYNDALLTAHFEVPGEMFTLAMEARAARDGGVVGSTQNILDFIAAKLQDALGKPFPERLQVGHCRSSTAVTRAASVEGSATRAAGCAQGGCFLRSCKSKVPGWT